MVTKVERVEIIVTDLASRVRRQMSSGPYDTGPQGSPLGKPVLVRVFAGDVVGQGQVRPISPGHFVPETTSSVVSCIRDVYGPCLLGRDVFDLEGTWSAFDRVLPGNSNARAVIDFALHDAMGKATGLPVHQLIGGLCQARIPLEWSVSLADDPKQMVDDAVRAVDEHGIGVLCLKAGGVGGWRKDVRNFSLVRDAVGEDVTIGIDPNTGWTVSDTIKALAELLPLGVGYIEQPIDRYDVAGLALVRRSAAGVPLMADESLFSLQDALRLVTEQAVDVFCIKLYKTGGLRQAKRISAIAEAANVRVNVGGLAVQSQLEAAASAHFYASTGVERVMPAAEFIFGLGVAGEDPLVGDTDFVIRDGWVDVPRGVGLGIVLDDRALKARTIQREVVVA